MTALPTASSSPTSMASSGAQAGAGVTKEPDLVAVEQFGYCIFGYGSSADAALEDASQWLDEGMDLGSITWNASPKVGETRLVRITAALVEEVRQLGGDLRYGSLPDGTLATEAEVAQEALGASFPA